jgi:CubicO group peptidase (beta-lactamase class C family)
MEPRTGRGRIRQLAAAAWTASTLAVALCASSAELPARKPPAGTRSGAVYYPDRFDWQRRAPQQAGLDPARLEEAVQFTIAHENPATKDLAVDLATTFGRNEPFDTAIGPVQARGSANGLVVRGGYIVAEWGDTSRVDMTFSVTKSFLSTVVGLAWQKGLIGGLADRAADYWPALFEGPHNGRITWDHLLRQTSDWQGTLWGKPDWADRPEGETPGDWPNRKVSEPGTRYKYNDVRVNVLALLTLHVLRRPLPQVLREEVMEPIGASSTWRWPGYDNSWIELDGQKVQSVSGGGHWGGGMFINARDMARFGYLFPRNGRWKDRQIVSPEWIALARTPGKANPNYGFMNWFLNTGGKPAVGVPPSAVMFAGAGQNIIYIDWDNDMVAVVRWIQGGPALYEFLAKLVAAVRGPSASGR